MDENLYPGKPQRWAINFSNGLQEVNDIHDLLNGKLKIFSYPQVEFDAENFNWQDFESRSTNPTFLFYQHTLKWIDQLIETALSASELAKPSADMATTVAREWWEQYLANKDDWNTNEYKWSGHVNALRATTLLGLTDLLPREAWLRDALDLHLVDLVENFDGYWNHGLAQSLALIGCGSRLGNADAVSLGVERATACLDVMVDEEGCINEQAPEYANYIEKLTRDTIKIFRFNGIGNTDKLEKKKLALREFIAHAVEPGGTFVELGDSFPRTPKFMNDSPVEYLLSNGAGGVQIPRVKIYQQGFVFGRSGFGALRPQNKESFYTLRFGPKRIIHGHNDHGSITYWSEGRKVIIDPGHIGYTKGEGRRYVQSHDAHNVLTVAGRRHDWSAETSLDWSEMGEHWQSFRVTDEAYKGFQRTRSICFTDTGPFVVLDKAEPTSGRFYFTQRWNIAREFEFVGSTAEAVQFRSTRDGLKLFLIRYAISDTDPFGDTSLDLSRGEQEPMMGWVAEGEKLVPTWNASFGVRSEKPLIATAVFTAGADETVGWSHRAAGPHRSVLRVHIDSVSWSFNLDFQNKEIRGRQVPKPKIYGGGGIHYRNI